MVRKRLKISLAVAGCLAALCFLGWRIYNRLNDNLEPEYSWGYPTQVPKSAKRLPPLTAGPADWPCWRGPNGDGKSDQKRIRTDWSGGLKKLWEADFLCTSREATPWSSVVVRGNRLVTMGRDKKKDLVLCLDSASGELLWKQSYEAKTRTSSYGRGARATPCIDGDKVYTFSRDGLIGCWQLFDGAKLWLKDTRKLGGKPSNWGLASSPLVTGNLVVVQAGGTARTIAFNKVTGDVAWKSGNGNAGYSAATKFSLNGARQILVFHGTGLSSYQPADGKELWTIDWATKDNVNAATPAIEGNLVFITSAYDMGCAVIRVDESGAKKLWTSKVIASHHSDPIIIDGYIYSYSGRSHQNEGPLKCVELKTGVEKWSTGEAGWGMMLYAAGYLICLDVKGNLHLIKPSPKAFINVASMAEALPKTRGYVWTAPSLANGRLYLRHRNRLACYDIAPDEVSIRGSTF